MSMAGDVWFGFSWVLNQLPKLSPIKRFPDLAALADRHSDELPGVDVFVTTVDPVDEPILYTVNTILSILAADYPVAKFAELWVPFYRKHCVEPRAPGSYFAMKTQAYRGGVAGELMSDRRRVRREYEEFKRKSLAKAISEKAANEVEVASASPQMAAHFGYRRESQMGRESVVYIDGGGVIPSIAAEGGDSIRSKS
uniref:Uncharacterized protein n=1 Tax=Oryza meridionalis TaxID=40149 RepID=A0A0E0ECY0_9ORYZ